jgi:hypothetical protein
MASTEAPSTAVTTGERSLDVELPEPTLQALHQLKSIARLAEAAHRIDLVRRLQREAHNLMSPQPATIVIVGEPRVGKTALLNALIGRPGLLPTGDVLGTAAPVIVMQGETEGAVVYAADHTEGVRCALADINQYVSATHNPSNRKGVLHLDVRVTAAVLTGLRIVDTPGIDGLESGQGQAALAALEAADALLFVGDAGVPLSMPEVRFLVRASERIDRVMIARTRIDRAPHWRRVLAADRDALRAVSDVLAQAPLVGASPRLAEGAMSLLHAGAPEKARRLHELSGTGTVARWLQQQGSQVPRVRVANAMALGRAVIRDLDGWYAEVQSSLSAGVDRRASELQHTQAELSRGAGRCRGKLSDDLAQLERHRLNWLQDEIAQLRRTFEVDIRQHWQDHRHERFAEELQPHLLALTNDLQEGLRTDLQKITDKYISELGLDALDAYAADLRVPERKLQQAQPLPPRDQRQLLYAARQSISNGRMGRPMIHLVTAAVGLPGAGFLVSAGLAAATFKLNMGSLARADQQQEAMRLLRDILETWMRDVGLAVTDYMRDARRRLDEGLADAVATRMADLNADVDRLKAEVARPDVAGRAETVARTKAELAQLDESARRLLANADTPNWGTV